jgi:hypothetical protein
MFGIGVMEQWSTGVMEKIGPGHFLVITNTPSLQYSSTPLLASIY